jgi:hypothetical protein
MASVVSTEARVQGVTLCLNRLEALLLLHLLSKVSSMDVDISEVEAIADGLRETLGEVFPKEMSAMAIRGNAFRGLLHAHRDGIVIIDPVSFPDSEATHG